VAARKKKANSKKIPLALIFLSSFLLAVLAWYFWSDLETLTEPTQKKVAAKRTRESRPEEISEQERKDLDNILKRR